VLFQLTVSALPVELQCASNLKGSALQVENLTAGQQAAPNLILQEEEK
jgi:hypothetical protein